MTPKDNSGNAGRPLAVEVAIIGAGPVGLMTANLLGLAGIRVLVLERNAGLLGLPRAIAYDAETLRLFSQVGLFDEIAPGLIQDPHVRHLNARNVTLMAADFPRGLYGHSSLGTFYQPDFERVLLKGLARFPSVQVAFEHEATDLVQNAKGVTLSVATPSGATTVEADYRRRLRRRRQSRRGSASASGSSARPIRNAGWWSTRTSGITASSRSLSLAIRAGLGSSCPRSASGCGGSSCNCPGESEETLKRDETIRALVAEAAGAVSFEIERKAVYTFHARVAEHWRRGRVFLAGDAAHLMPPFAGQGMNGGMKDASNLAWKLAAVLRGLAPDAILDTYEVERAPVVRKMVEVSRRLGAVIMPTNRIAAAARDSIFACLNLSSRFRAFIRRGGVVPPPAIRRSALTSRDRDALVGQMAPQPTVSAGQGASPLDRFLGCHQWLALGVGVDPATMMSARDLAILEALGARFICLNGSARNASTLSVSCDDPAFADWARAPRRSRGSGAAGPLHRRAARPRQGPRAFFSPSPPP